LCWFLCLLAPRSFGRHFSNGTSIPLFCWSFLLVCESNLVLIRFISQTIGSVKQSRIDIIVIHWLKTKNVVWYQTRLIIKSNTGVYKKKRNLGISQEIDIVLRTKDFRCLGI
jgi:hypothetical protein